MVSSVNTLLKINLECGRKTALESVWHWWLNRQRQLKKDQKTHNKPICVASAAVRNKTGNFEIMDSAEDTPHRACLKAFHEGIPVPVAERE